MNTPVVRTALPIVVIHRNDCEYLKHTIAQARASNPESPIYLLGSGVTERFDGVKHVDLSGKYFGSWMLRFVYRHLNETSVQFERLCIQRWFVLRDFLVRNNISRCLYIDTDVLLYTDVTSEQRTLDNCDLAMIKRTGLLDPHVCYVNNVNTLRKFCNFVLRTYTNPAEFSDLKRWYKNYHDGGHPGGVCDMILLARFDNAKRANICNLAGILESAAYDSSINSPEGFEMEEGLKRIYWTDDLPFGKLAETGELVRFKALHFQAASKHKMSQYVRR